MRSFAAIFGIFVSVLAFEIRAQEATQQENRPYFEGRLGIIAPYDSNWSGTLAGVASSGDIQWDQENLAYGGELGIKNVAGTSLRVGVSVITTSFEPDQICADSGTCVALGGEYFDAEIYLGNIYYDFDLDGVQPFIGIGIGFIDDGDRRVASSAALGVSLDIDENFYVSFRGDYIYADTAASKNFGGGTSVTPGDLDAWSFGVAIGYRY